MRPEEAQPAQMIFELPGTYAAIGDVVERIIGAVLACSRAGRCHRLNEGVIDELRIAWTEALNNSIEHGYSGREGAPLRLALWCRDARVALTIADLGQALPPGLLEGGGCEPHLGEGGRGWHLIHATTDRVAYARRDGWNLLILEKAL
ncbi:MAG: ATP-binding protein [Paracoccaceae bacterium]